MYSPRVVNRVCGQTWQGITLQQGWGPSDSSPRDPDSGQSFSFFFFFYFITPLTLKSTNKKKEKSVTADVQGPQAQEKPTQIGSKKRTSVCTLEKKEKSGCGTNFYPFRSEKGP